MGIAGSNADEGPSDATLLARIALRDRDAFADLFARVAPRVKSYLMRLGATGASADELTQDVMLTVWRKAETFDPAKAGALTWIFVIARNRRIDSLRRERAVVIYGDVPDYIEDEAAPRVSDVIEGARRDDRVRAALDALSPDQREVVRRSFFEEEPHSTIAAALGLPLGTVKSRLRLAMNKLRTHLEDLR